jgi:thioredoxin reductase (NADPH)
MKQTELLVVGAGPAGLTAGIYSARAGHQTLIIEKAFSGGQMALTSEVENYPGFSEPVNGMLLAQTMEQQATRFGCEIMNAEATAIRRSAYGFEVLTSAGPVVGKAVVICTGVKSRKLGVPGEEALSGRGVSYCAVCDGPLYKGREVAVVGGGDSALDEGLYLSNIASRVHVIHRRDQFRGCKLAQQKLAERPNVVLHLSTVATAIQGANRVESLALADTKDGKSSVLPVTGVFIYVGWLPNTAWCAALVRLDETGDIVADTRLHTNVLGVFAAGDVRNTPLRQVATAVGDGALAAMSAHEFLSKGGIPGPDA